MHIQQKKLETIQSKLGKAQLVVATKYTQDPAILKELAHYQIHAFGENRVQDFLKKYDPQFSWHFIGHLQTNKVKDIITKVDLIHSVDSIRLIDEIEKQAALHNITAHILLEVNIAKEESKYGFREAEMPKVLTHLRLCKHVTVHGLMMMAPYIDKEAARIYFQQTRHLRDQLQARFPEFSLKELSMGMSNDYDIALQEGATIIRVGRLVLADD